MNTLYDQFQRCIRHPHQRIVGVCSSCLQERLTSLIQPPSPVAEVRRSHNAHEHARGFNTNNHVTAALERERPVHTHSYVVRPNLPSNNVIDGITDIVPLSNGETHTQEKATVCMHLSSASTSTAPRNHDDVRNSHMQRGKHHGHHPSSDFASHARPRVYQNGHIDKQDRNTLASSSASLEKKNRAAQAQNWQTEVSFSEGDKKKGGSWFSLSKSKSSSHVTYSQVDGRGLTKHVSKSPRHNAAPTERNLDASRHAHRPDLEAIAEINTSDASSKVQTHISREAGTSTSWISVLFHRKKGSRSRSNLSNSSSGSVQNAISDANGHDINSGEPNHRQNSIEAGRLSWDGTRPNFKQLLKRIETRSKPQVPPDFSPSQYVDYAMKEYNDNGREITNQAAYLQKSKSVASARSSISVEMPKDLMQSSFSPTLHQGQSNVMVGLDYDTYYDDRNLRRSRSWGRTWNRALSPLWGSRSHRHKVTLDASASAHQRDYSRMRTPVTPSHVNLKSAATPASSAHLSPLRRSKLAPTLRNLL